MRAINNLTVGLGAFTLAASGEFHGNYPALCLMLADPQALDFGLPQQSPLRWFGADTANLPDNLKPAAKFTLPIGTRPLASPANWAPGALQTKLP